ncbi:MAG: SDR family NAD(P)-dependent oxidoreductase [Actinomycetota bacterium]|nr:SDR family NAD(P)-dependent oxidoreductase [Actinomycetota bacterium]
MDIDGKIALITGGASGLGRATAEELTGAGAAVVLADLPGSPGEEAVSALGDRARFCPTDVTDADQVAAAVDACFQLGGLHIVVNCAGVGWPGRVLNRDGEPHDLDRFETVIRINLIGTFNVIRLAAARMIHEEPIDDERGVIINTASVAAFEGQIGQAAYAASKGGVRSLTLPVARDLAEKLIRCVAIAPGTFDTPMLAGLPQKARESLAVAVPHPTRLGRPDEYAALARHVIENQMINGATIRLDGALRMAPR